MKKILLFFILVAWRQTALASDSTAVVTDSIAVQYFESTIEVRDFDQEKIIAYKSDEDYNYETSKSNFSITQWLKGIINWLFGKINTKWLAQWFGWAKYVPWTILFYIITGIIISYAILKLLGVDIKEVFRKTSDKGTIAFDLVEEDIHEMDFELLIEEAVEKKEFRKAVRLFYLFSLKKLSDKHLIAWKPGKTNHEYITELQGASVKSSFDNLSYYFEYLWYGDFEINQDIFAKAKLVFEELKTQVEGHRE